LETLEQRRLLHSACPTARGSRIREDSVAPTAIVVDTLERIVAAWSNVARILVADCLDPTRSLRVYAQARIAILCPAPAVTARCARPVAAQSLDILTWNLGPLDIVFTETNRKRFGNGRGGGQLILDESCQRRVESGKDVRFVDGESNPTHAFVSTRHDNDAIRRLNSVVLATLENSKYTYHVNGLELDRVHSTRHVASKDRVGDAQRSFYRIVFETPAGIDMSCPEQHDKEANERDHLDRFSSQCAHALTPRFSAQRSSVGPQRHNRGGA
jgi:hypothetical protein